MEADWFTPLSQLLGKVKKKIALLHPQPVGYEPADRIVHPTPRTAEGGLIFFV